MAELVCSNSLRSNNPENAVGLLKAELRLVDSPILAAADEARVPAGDALAVDRERFSAGGRAAGAATLGRIGSCVARPTGCLPPQQLAVVATGPLTSEPLAKAIAAAAGQSALYFYDAIAPIVAADSVEHGHRLRSEPLRKGGGRRLPEPARSIASSTGPSSEALRDGEKVPPTTSRSRGTSRAACPSRSWPSGARTCWPTGR